MSPSFAGRVEDEPDGRTGAKSASAKSRSSSVPANRDRKTFATPKPPSGRVECSAEKE